MKTQTLLKTKNIHITYTTPKLKRDTTYFINGKECAVSYQGKPSDQIKFCLKEALHILDGGDIQ